MTKAKNIPYTRKIWFISEGTLQYDDSGLITTEIEKEFEISPDMYETILYASHNIINNGNININNKKDLQTIENIKRISIAPKLRWKILQRDNFKCVKCGRGVNEVDCLQVDHIIAVTKGGTNKEENLQTLCWDCNVGKFNK